MIKETFSFARRVAWGECDPARIYYTPCAVDYAVEALNAWYEEVLGASLPELAARHDLDVSFVRVDCHYLRPLFASQVVSLRVWVTEVGGGSLTFEVSGGGPDGRSCFVARLVTCFVGRQERLPVQIPQLFRERIESYRQQCDAHPSERYVLNWAGLSAGGGEGPAGESRQPQSLRREEDGEKGSLTRLRRVAYGDCDPSGCLSAPKVYVYAVELVGEWFEEILGVSWLELVCKHDQGAPFVSISCHYRRPMVPGQKLILVLEVVKMGRASLEFAVFGVDTDGTHCFDALLTACFVNQSGFTAIRIPEGFRQKIRNFMGTDVSVEDDSAV